MLLTCLVNVTAMSYASLTFQNKILLHVDVSFLGMCPNPDKRIVKYSVYEGDMMSTRRK